MFLSSSKQEVLKLFIFGQWKRKLMSFYFKRDMDDIIYEYINKNHGTIMKPEMKSLAYMGAMFVY